MSTIFKTACCCILISCLAACQSDTNEGATTPVSATRIWNTNNVFPGENWEVRTPESQGIDPATLQIALDTLRTYCGSDGLNEVVVIRNGYLIHQGANAEKQHNIFSCTQTITSMALGLITVDHRARLTDSLYRLWPPLTGIYSGVNFFHFATMTSGFNSPSRSRWDGGNSHDWGRGPYIPGPPFFAPGMGFSYWEEAQMMYGHAVTRAAREDLQVMVNYRVMAPMQMGEWKWGEEGSVGAFPIRNGTTGIELNALQLAKIGWLYQNRGRWGDRQLVDANWVGMSTMNQVPVNLPLAEDPDKRGIDGRGAYGFNWWINGKATNGAAQMPNTPLQTYYMNGHNNNMCFVIPEWNMVFVRLGVDGDPFKPKYEVYDRVFRELGKGIQL